MPLKLASAVLVPIEVVVDGFDATLRLREELTLSDTIDALAPKNEVLNELGTFLGKHLYCGGNFSLRRISKTRAIVICDRSCIAPVYLELGRGLTIGHLDSRRPMRSG